jgi:serine/threonine-protein kinase
VSGSGAPPVTDGLHALCLADAVWAERYDGWFELGRGASAVLVRAHCRAVADDLALKVFPRLRPEEERRFRQEVRCAQRLASPFIVRTYSAFLRGSLAWIEMELVDGPDLGHALAARAREGRPFSLAEGLELAAALAEGLRLAHEAEVVHRDIKPANILLPRSGRPAAKLGDFGISRALDSTRVTATGVLAGTPQFAAPEIINGAPASPASDVYSLALTLYLVFAGNRFPFAVARDAPPARWMKAHLEEAPQPLRALRPEVPAALDDLLLRALEKDPRRRPTAQDLLEAVAAAPRASAPPPPPGWRRRAGLAAALLGGGLLVLALRGPWSPATGAPAAATLPAPRPEPPFASAPVALFVEEEVLRVVARTSADLPVVGITLRGEDGRRFAAEVLGGLGAGDEVLVALDAFTPALPPGLRVSGAEVRWRATPAATEQQALVPVGFPAAPRPGT